MTDAERADGATGGADSWHMDEIDRAFTRAVHAPIEWCGRKVCSACHHGYLGGTPIQANWPCVATRALDALEAAERRAGEAEAERDALRAEVIEVGARARILAVWSTDGPALCAIADDLDAALAAPRGDGRGEG